KVTDGWYPIDAALDGALAHFLRRGKGKIAPGTKLAIANAALEAGAGPIERDAGEFPPGAGPRLRLAVNSCRRARWDARLGF
ncbi:unnamed protein product, partial [Ectocarpus sp. 12 AP-2014]